MPVPPEKIIELAKKAGFESELKVAAMLSKAGWKFKQNVYYIDKDEKIGRELDIYGHYALHDLGDSPEVTCYVNLCIEVKRTSQPFIFFTSGKEYYEHGTGYSILNWHEKIDRFVLSYDDIEKLRPDASPIRIGRSFVSFKDEKAQQIKSGVLSALKGAIHFTEDCNEVYSSDSRDICFFIPVVVVDGPLYECYFHEESSELVAEPVEIIVYMQNYLSENYGAISNRVYVMTLPAFQSRLSAYQEWAASMFETMKERRSLYRGQSAD